VFFCAINSLPAHYVIVVIKFSISTMSAKFLKQYKAVFLINHLKRPKLTNKAATKYMRKSESFVKKWVKRYLIGNVDDFAGEMTNDNKTG